MKNLHDISCISECDDVILCSGDEKFLLWCNYSKESSNKNQIQLDWVDNSRGFHKIIGEINNRPIAIITWFSKIENRLIGFVKATSQLVDYKMIEDWIESKTNKRCYNSSNFLRAVKG